MMSGKDFLKSHVRFELAVKGVFRLGRFYFFRPEGVPGLWASNRQNTTADSWSLDLLHQKTCRMKQPLLGSSVRENVVSHSKKRKKSRFFGFWKKNVKNVRSFTGQLTTQPLIAQLPEVSTGKSRSPTSNILLRSVDTRNYATENCMCDKRL